MCLTYPLFSAANYHERAKEYFIATSAYVSAGFLVSSIPQHLPLLCFFYFDVVFCLLSCFFYSAIPGVIFLFYTTPDLPEQSIYSQTKSLLSDRVAEFAGDVKLSDKIKKWLPAAMTSVVDTDLLPDYTQEFWTPIRVKIQDDPLVTMCKLNFQAYSSAPHETPMFRDLLTKSHCDGSNKRVEHLSKLLLERQAAVDLGGPDTSIPPTGFIFHEGRVGSTLVANLLGSNPFAMVFSESEPPVEVLTSCHGCTRKRQVQLFRDIVSLMANSPVHRYAFFKFQSVSAKVMEVALEAFPETPWAFVYRQPVQTMMSQVGPGKPSGGPCLRSKHERPAEIVDVLNAIPGGKEARHSNEAWCAGHLNMLCAFALAAYEKYATFASDNSRQRGMLLNYESLPGAVPRALLPMFGIRQVPAPWLRQMAVEAGSYSKSRGAGTHNFQGDSEEKDSGATPAIRNYAQLIMQPTFEKMTHLSKDALERVMSEEEYDVVESSAADRATPGLDVDWVKLSVLPVPHEERVAHAADEDTTANLRRHSTMKEVREFVPWSPFANTHKSKAFKVATCPDFPPPGYPEAYKMLDIVDNWNPDDTNIPEYHYDSLCHFDARTEMHKAENYRQAELPFIVYNHPEVDETARRWGDIDYLERKLGTRTYRTETSNSNHFMYFRNKRKATNPDGSKWVQPTHEIHTSFEDWLKVAVQGQNATTEERKHQYFRVSSDMGNPFIFDELPFFKPVKSFFIVEPRQQQGIHCRFGMKGVIAEAHFDGSRNSVAQMAGLRRWILTHPNQCEEMHMFQHGHPSARHSQVDWSKPDVKKYPNFKNVVGNEVILQPGDVLYVPTYWIHYIVSLDVNIQCNTRSGITHGYDQDLKRCGF